MSTKKKQKKSPGLIGGLIRKFVPRGRLVVELGDADNDGRADIQASLEVGEFRVKAGPLNLDASEALALISRSFAVVQDAARQRLGWGHAEMGVAKDASAKRWG